MKTYEAADQEVHDGYLMDIAFEMRQGESVRALRAKHFFTDNMFWGLTNNLKKIRANKERLVNEYEQRYDKTPDIEFAKRLFLKHEESAGGAGGGTGNADNDDPIPQPDDLGDKTA